MKLSLFFTSATRGLVIRASLKQTFCLLTYDIALHFIVFFQKFTFHFFIEFVHFCINIKITQSGQITYYVSASE